MKSTTFSRIRSTISILIAALLLSGCGETDSFESPVDGRPTISAEDWDAQPTTPPEASSEVPPESESTPETTPESSPEATPETPSEDVPTNEVQTFTMDAPASYPVLNVIVDNPMETFVDERNFLKIMEVGAAGTDRDTLGHYQDSIKLEAGRYYSLLIHVHNDADGGLGDNGVATNVGFALSHPVVISGDATISVLLTADNTVPLIIGDSIAVHSDEELLITFADSEGPYPVKRYNYAMKAETEIAIASATVTDTTTISGEIGDLSPGYTAESGAYIYLWFQVQSVPQ